MLFAGNSCNGGEPGKKGCDMMEQVFDVEKKYKLSFLREGVSLTFTGTKVKQTGELISFIDRNGQQFIFHQDQLIQANEVEE